MSVSRQIQHPWTTLANAVVNNIESLSLRPKAMSLLDQYQVVSMVGAGETNTFRAQETATGRLVLLHQFLRGQTFPNQPDLISLVYQCLSRADAPGIEHFLDSGEEGDCVTIVTSDVPECLDLRRWLQSMATALGAGATLDEFSLDQPEPEGLVLDFPLEPQPESHAGPAAESPSAPAPPQVVARKSPGEFTSMFFGTAAAEPPAAQAPTPESKPEEGPGERRPRGQVPSGFEVVFQSKKQPLPATPPSEADTPTVVVPTEPPAVAAGGAPFRASRAEEKFPLSRDPSPAKEPFAPAPVSAQPASAPAKTGPSEFTLMFQGIGADTSKAPAPSRQDADATAAFSPPPAPRKPLPGTFGPSDVLLRPAPPAPAPIAAKPPAPPAAAAPKQPGEFTLMFHAGGQTPARPAPPVSASQGRQPAPVAAPRPPAPAHPPATTESAAPTPGEFTSLFKTGKEPARTSGPRASSALPLSSSSKQGPGEFTQMMQGYKGKVPAATPAPPIVLDTPQRPAPAPAADSGKRAPGELTMLFQAPRPVAPAAPAAPSRPAVPAAPVAEARPQPGQYTRMFESPRTPATSPLPAPQAAPPAPAGYPAVIPVPAAVPPVPVYQAPPPPAAPPLAYPQVPQYQVPPPPAYAPPPAPQMQPVAFPPPAAPQPAPPVETKKPAIFWVLLLVLGCLFLSAVVLVLFFALKH